MPDAREIPEGYVAFGWYTGGESLRPRSTTMGVWTSMAHLAPEEQTQNRLATTRPLRPYEAVCGARKRTRRGRVEFPNQVAREANLGQRKWCPRCWKLVSDA